MKANVFTKTQALTDVVSEYIPVSQNTTYKIKSYVYDNDPYLYGKFILIIMEALIIFYQTILPSTQLETQHLGNFFQKHL